MGTLTEVEIFDVVTSNLRDAASNCDLLAKLPAQGPTYIRFRENLKLIEGGCRQMGFFREDMRYQMLGFKAAECHQRAGGWIRMHAARDLFFKLAESLRKIEFDMQTVRHAKTGRRGPILPKEVAVHRDTRPVQVTLPSGLIVPASMH